MEQSSSWEAASCSASKKIPCILWILIVLYSLYMNLAWDRSIQSMPPPFFLKVSFNIILIYA